MSRSLLQTSVVPALQALRQWALQHLCNTRALLFVMVLVPMCAAMMHALGAPAWLWVPFYAVFLGLMRLLHRPILDYWGRYMPGGSEAEHDRQARRLNPWQLSSLISALFVFVILLVARAPAVIAVGAAAWFLVQGARSASQATALYAANAPPRVESTIEPGPGRDDAEPR